MYYYGYLYSFPIIHFAICTNGASRPFYFIFQKLLLLLLSFFNDKNAYHHDFTSYQKSLTPKSINRVDKLSLRVTRNECALLF